LLYIMSIRPTKMIDGMTGESNYSLSLLQFHLPSMLMVSGINWFRLERMNLTLTPTSLQSRRGGQFAEASGTRDAGGYSD